MTGRWNGTRVAVWRCSPKPKRDGYQVYSARMHTLSGAQLLALNLAP